MVNLALELAKRIGRMALRREKSIFETIKLGSKTVHLIGFRHGGPYRRKYYLFGKKILIDGATARESEAIRKYLDGIQGTKTILGEVGGTGGEIDWGRKYIARVTTIWREIALPRLKESLPLVLPLEPGRIPRVEYILEREAGIKPENRRTERYLHARGSAYINKIREREGTAEWWNLGKHVKNFLEEVRWKIRYRQRNRLKDLSYFRSFLFADSISRQVKAGNSKNIVALMGSFHVDEVKRFLLHPRLVQEVRKLVPKTAKDHLWKNEQNFEYGVEIEKDFRKRGLA